MSPTYEARLLRKLLRQIDRGPPPFLQSKWSDVLLWLVLFALFFVLFQAGHRLPYLALVVIWVTIGVLVGVYKFCKLAAKQWPYVQLHLNRESIASRLRQLEL